MTLAKHQRPTLSLELPGELVLYVTQQQFETLAIANRDLKLERTAAGELIVNPPTGGESGKRNLSISTQLGNWFEAHENLGEAFDSSTGFKLLNGADRSPDASWVSRGRWQSLSSQQKKDFVSLCPDFVVELRSESDRLSRLQVKLQEYIRHLQSCKALIRKVCSDQGKRCKKLIINEISSVELYCC